MPKPTIVEAFCLRVEMDENISLGPTGRDA